MINEKEIMPFNFFKYGGIYTGGHNGMRYKIERTGEKPDYVLNVLIWQGPYASTAMKEEDITSKEFEYSEEGRSSAIQWIQDMYDTNIDRWENAPSINQVKSTLEQIIIQIKLDNSIFAHKENILLRVSEVTQDNRLVINLSAILDDVTAIILKLNGVIILFMISGLK